ncbi:hypothetical protein AaE_009325 [Aphanomyces astaci]|uniref:Core-binding (CB) domain-containing protein n=1 Tax=Aphanomyces astaci TaxID=112090 RepID=A0A6A5A846_APHAT|nr:hypothetical protein AaE_009325 [Aphanomyces astaci]
MIGIYCSNMAETTSNDPLLPTTTRQLSTTVQDLRDNRLAMSSKRSYRSGVKQLGTWLQSSGRSSMVNADGTINLAVFSYNDFTEFILYKYKHAGVSLSTLSSYRSAIKDHYNSQNVPLPTEFATDATVIYQGALPLYSSGVPNLKQGFDGFAQLRPKPGPSSQVGNNLFDSTNTKFCASTAFQKWTLVSLISILSSHGTLCASRSTESVRIDHLSDEGDAIGVTFFKSKTDQGGTKRRDPKHVYANPMRPETCCILALGIYLACNAQHDSGNLFPGKSQRDRFGRSLCQLVGVALPAASSSVGTHSLRKGAATYAIGGSTSGPSIVNVCIRCGWSIGSVVERYVHYDGAGDQYVGRVVAGLPLDSGGFAVLPPHFVACSEAMVANAGAVVFPRLWVHEELRGVLKLCLASLVYHKEFLEASLPPKHQLLASVLFGDLTLANTLSSTVTLASNILQPTGIPPHVGLHAQLEQTSVPTYAPN